MDAFGTAYIVPGFTAEALLALAFWPGAAQKDFGYYWAARFHVSVQEDLIEVVMPGLTQLPKSSSVLLPMQALQTMASCNCCGSR